VPKPIQTLAPSANPTLRPFQVPGEIQKPGEIQQLPPYVWPTIGEFQRPGAIQQPGNIQQPREIQAVPGVPPTAQCLTTAKLQPNGAFTGESFKFEVAQAPGECVVPAGLVLKSADGKQDMLVMASVKVNASAGPTTVTVYANCMDINKHGPEPGSKYSVGGMVPASSELGKVIAGLPKVSADKITAAGLQGAVWSITNDVSRDHISKVLKFEQKDLDSARSVLESGGVATAGKSLFK